MFKVAIFCDCNLYIFSRKSISLFLPYFWDLKLEPEILAFQFFSTCSTGFNARTRSDWKISSLIYMWRSTFSNLSWILSCHSYNYEYINSCHISVGGVIISSILVFCCFYSKQIWKCAAENATNTETCFLGVLHKRFKWHSSI